MPRIQGEIIPMKGWTQDDVDAFNAAKAANAKKLGKAKLKKANTMPPLAKPKRKHGPNKLEEEALIWLVLDAYEFEGKKFDICGGATYKPDWVHHKNKIAVEVKCEYIHSRDSRRRFDEAKHLHPDWTWIWMRKRTKGRKGKRWEIEIYEYE